MILITDFDSDPMDISEREAIILSGRVHPGESSSSFVVEGLIEFLTSDEIIAQRLRQTFVFKIVPMLNADGVIVGNTRCSIGGLDLNRHYLNPDLKDAPEIRAIKNVIR